MTFRIAKTISKAMLGHQAARAGLLLAHKSTWTLRRSISTTGPSRRAVENTEGLDRKIMVDWVSSTGRPVARIPLLEGESLLDAARREKIELEGACDGSLACSTCHVVLQKHVYELLDSPSEHEADLLDLACGLEREPRLGCQVKLDRLSSDKQPIVVKLASTSESEAPVEISEVA